jgi:hypothetical protein
VTPLLRAAALQGRTVGISVSESPDLGRLDLLESHVTVILGEIARVVLASGGTLAYGGRPDPGGYTAFLLSELQRYGHRGPDPLLKVYLAWSEHQRLTRDELAERLDVGSWGEVICLDPDGRVIPEPLANRSPAADTGLDDTLKRRALTAMRRVMAENTDGRVLLGGKRSGFAGVMPGLMEEALLTLQAGTPLYLAAGLGGVTVDIVRALDVDDCAWLPPDPDAGPEDPRLAAGRARLAAERNAPEWGGLRNGLSDDENRRLAVTHRPGEIATLVVLGLGRLAT